MTDFEINFRELFSLGDDMSYFYHITGSGIGNIIINKGLMMVERNLNSTTIQINQSMISDPLSFIDNEHGHNIRHTDEMVLIGCPTEEVDNLVIPNYEETSSWTIDDKPNYIIPNHFIMGYIDMSNYDIVLNENYDYDINLGYSKIKS